MSAIGCRSNLKSRPVVVIHAMEYRTLRLRHTVPDLPQGCWHRGDYSALVAGLNLPPEGWSKMSRAPFSR